MQLREIFLSITLYPEHDDKYASLSVRQWITHIFMYFLYFYIQKKLEDQKVKPDLTRRSKDFLKN